ncbi:MAG: tetratricopeptide repeat protein [Lachnospiraceae bacterium]|nr:tetratricopeptide repeat protein [Lachnospiraceae bacterium]
MKTITLYTVSPAGGEEEEYGRMEKFAEEVNRFYKKFNNLKVEITAYGMTLPVKKDGKYAVKVVQTPVAAHVRKSALCCIIFFCKKEEVSEEEMNLLIRGLMQMKKAEIMVYFKPNEDMQPVRNDIMKRIVRIDEKMGVPREDRKRLSDMAKNFINLGCAYDRENRLKDAEGAYKEALVIQRKLSKADEETYLPDLALPYHNLGTLYYRTNRLKEAEVMYTEALGIRKKLLEKKGDAYLPLVAASGLNMGALYMRSNRLEDAEKIYQEVLEIREKLAAQSPENDGVQLQLADIYGNMGSMYSRMKRTEDAETYFRKSLEIEEKLLEKRKNGREESSGAQNAQEQNLQIQRESFDQELKKKAALVSNTLGVLCLNQNRREEAEKMYLLSYELYTGLAEKKADEFEPPLAMVSFNLGNIYRGMKQPEKAAPYMEKTWDICSARKDSNSMCKQIYDSMSEALKEASQKQAEIAGLLKKQGKEYHDSGRYEDAIKSYQQAAGLYRGMDQAEYQSEAALLYNELGMLNWDTNQLEEAEASYKAALEIYRKLAEKDETRLPDAAVASYNLGRFRQETRDEDVNEYLREAFEIAGKCREYSEQCRDIYENLEDEPLYEEENRISDDDVNPGKEDMADGRAADGTETAPAGADGIEADSAAADSTEADSEAADGAEAGDKAAAAEQDSDKKSWWQKFWKK